MIVVTGASKGLGRAICTRLMSNGYSVLGLARGECISDFPTLKCDVSSPDDIKSVVASLKSSGVQVKALINVAGIASMNLALTTPTKTAIGIINTNLLGTIFCCQAFAPLIIRSGGGSIINFSTIAVALGLKGESIYAASKAGVEGFTRSFAREMADFSIRANCIAPGPINTDLLKGVSSKQIDAIVSDQIIPTQFEPTHVCDIVDLLLDDRSLSISGQVIHVGGV